MKITLSKRIGLLAFLLPCALALSTTVHAETNKLVIEWICPYISRHLLSLNPLLACCRRYSRGER